MRATFQIKFQADKTASRNYQKLKKKFLLKPFNNFFCLREVSKLTWNKFYYSTKFHIFINSCLYFYLLETLTETPDLLEFDWTNQIRPHNFQL